MNDKEAGLTTSSHLIRYPNGFEVLHVPSSAAPVVAMELWVKVGSADEKLHEAGLAHLVEHMLFKGTAARPHGEIASEIEALGGEINAYTSADYTVYTVLLASRFALVGLEVLSDAVFASTFDADELDKEKGVVLEEILRSRDLPHQCLSQALFSEAYGTHAYGRPVIGTEEAVASFSRDDCLSFSRRWYRPDNMILVLAGQADLESLGAEMQTLFGGRVNPGRPLTRRRLRRLQPPSHFRMAVHTRIQEDAYFDLAFPGPSALHADLPALDALLAVLGQGEASRLQHRVKLDRNLVRSVGAGVYSPLGPGLLYVGGVADTGLLAEAFSAICEETFRLCRDPVGSRELERVKENLEADFLYQKETVQGQAEKAAFFHVVHGDVEAETRYVTAVRRLTPEILKGTAQKYFRARRGLLTALLPEGVEPPLAPDAATRTIEAAEQGGRRGLARSKRLRYRTNRVYRAELSNGARLLVRTNSDVPLVALRAAFLGGSLRETRDFAGIFHLLSSSFVRGTRSRDVFEIAHGVDAIGGQVDGFAGRNSFGLKGEFLSKYLEDGLELFAEILCQPAFPASELAKLREDTLAALRQRRDHPGSYAMRLFEEALYGQHPLALDPLGTTRSLRRLTRTELLRTFGVFARPESLCVAAVGDVDPEAVIDFFQTSLSHLGGAGKLPAEPARPITHRRPVHTRATLPVEQTHVVVGFLGTTVRSSDRCALRVAHSLLSGQGGRLFRRLRDELGLAYSVESTCVEGLHPGYVAAHAATSPNRAELARECLLAEFARIAAGDFTQREFDDARRKLVGGFEISLQENAFQAAQLALDEIYGLGHRGLESYPGDILAVSPQEVTAAARSYFDPHGHVSAVVGPKR